MSLSLNYARHLNSKNALDLRDFIDCSVCTIAGIGNPDRFFEEVKTYLPHTRLLRFPDHHPYTEKDLAAIPEQVVLMTEKDAVKIRPFADKRCYSLPGRVTLYPALLHKLAQKLKLPNESKIA